MIQSMNFWDFLSLFWRKRAIFLRCILLCLMAAFLFLWTRAPEYTVSMVVGPTSATGAAALGVRVPNELETAPSLAEHVQSEKLSDYARYLQLLTSRDVAERLIENTPGLMQSLFASEWDAKKKQWHFPGNASSIVRETIAVVLRRPLWRAPDTERLNNYLNHHVVMTPLGGSPMRRLSFRHRDKGLAVNIVLGLHKAADEILRHEAARRSDSITNYINQELGRVTIAEHRAALTRLMAEQERARILMEVDLPYAADLITPPAAPSDPDWPNPSLILGFALLLGTMIGCIVSVFMEMQRLRKKPVLRLLQRAS